MTKEQLIALGLSDEQATQVLDNVAKDDKTAELNAELERLRKHNETLLGEKKAETEKRRAEQAEKDRLAEETARKKGDFETLEKQYQDKIKALEQQLQDNIAERNHDLIASQALKIASQLSTNANNQELLQVFVKNRLTVDESGTLKVMDTNGNPTIQTLDELVGEFKTSGKYDSLIDGTRASGTGATGQANKTATDYTEAERVALAESNPQLFNQLFT